MFSLIVAIFMARKDDASASAEPHFCGLIDVNTMETIHFELLKYPAEKLVNWRYALPYKNIMFVMGANWLTICTIWNINMNDGDDNNNNNKHGNSEVKTSHWTNYSG